MTKQDKAWRALAEDGRVLQQDGRKVRLTFKDTYHEALALRAQRRWYRHAIRNKSLTLNESLPNARWFGTLLILNGLGLGALSRDGLLRAVDFLNGKGREFLPPDYAWLAVGMAMFIVLSVLFLALGSLVLGIWLLTATLVRRVEIKGGHLWATATDGHIASYALKDITSVKQWGTVAFGGVQVVRMLGARHRLRMAIRAAEREFACVQSPSQTDRKGSSALQWRLLLWSALGSVATYVLCKRFVIPDGTQNMGPWPAALLVMVPGTIAAIGLSTLPNKLLRYIHRRSRRRVRTRKLPSGDGIAVGDGIST